MKDTCVKCGHVANTHAASNWACSECGLVQRVPLTAVQRETERILANVADLPVSKSLTLADTAHDGLGAVAVSGRKMAGKSNPRRRAYPGNRPESPRSSPYDTWFLVWHGDPKIMDRGLMHEGTHAKMAAYKAGLVAKGLPAKSMKIERFKLKYAGQGR